VALIFCCGLAVSPWRQRSPLRCNPAALGLGEGTGSVETPGSRRAAPAAVAVRRVYARVVRNVGAGGACPAARWRQAAAASDAGASQRLRPLQAACAPTQRRPVRCSATPTTTASRLQPTIVSASRARPCPSGRGISAGQARLAAPVIVEAAKRSSCI
jgi:hypothetical protein